MSINVPQVHHCAKAKHICHGAMKIHTVHIRAGGREQRAIQAPPPVSHFLAISSFFLLPGKWACIDAARNDASRAIKREQQNFYLSRTTQPVKHAMPVAHLRGRAR
jgi:hypothetical protein